MTSESSPSAAGQTGAPVPGPPEPSLSRAELLAMNGQPLRRTVVITNPQGFHMRPVTAFAQLAAGFASNIEVSRDGRAVNGKSAWDMMAMLAPPGSELTVIADGPDAPAALEALIALIATLTDNEEGQEPPLTRKG